MFWKNVTDWLQNTPPIGGIQIQLKEYHCTELEAGNSFFRILTSIKLLSTASTVSYSDSYLASQNG